MDISNIRDTMELAYAQFLLDVRDKPFVWGEHDCVTFAARAMQIRTGRNPLATITWSSAEEAVRELKKFGGLRAAVTSVLGEPTHILGAKIGDIALIHDRKTDRDLLGVFHDGFVVCPSESGLAMVPTDWVVCRWKIR